MTRVFEKSPIPPPVGSTEFSPEVWDRVRSRVIDPEYVGALDETPELREEFLRGAALLGLALVDLDDQDAVDELRRREPQWQPLQPQQLLMADALNAGIRRTVVEVPRRGSKTTTILAWCLGRCASRSRYKITYSAQTGAIGVKNFDDWVREDIDRINPPDDTDLPPWLRGARAKPKAVARHEALSGETLLTEVAPARPTGGRGFTIRKGNTKTDMNFDNGSSFTVVRPEAGAYRGKAADVSWLDEAQEIDPVQGDDLIAGVLPLQDTRPGAMIVVSGTAGEARVGPLWKWLDRLRNGDPEVGGVDYAAPEGTDWEAIEDEDAAMRLIQRVHPGIGTLTTMEAMRSNWHDMAKPKWAREYLSMWPETMGVAAIPAGWWEAARLDRRPRIPDRVAFGLDVRPGGSVAAICAAWRTPAGTAYVEVIGHQSGTSWVPQRARELMKYSGATIAYDDIGEGKATATEVEGMRPKPRLRVQTYREHAAGCVQILRDLERGTLKHFGQASLDDAAATATKREVRSDNGVWLWGVGANGGDISTLVAATRALRNWDQHFARKGTSTVGIVAA